MTIRQSELQRKKHEVVRQSNFSDTQNIMQWKPVPVTQFHNTMTSPFGRNLEEIKHSY